MVRNDILDAVGFVQLCAGQHSGCEAAVYSVRESYLSEGTEAALLVDASNAFNSINRLSALHNIRHLCPSVSTVLVNCYRAPTSLFIKGDSILSQEGTTQGDPLGMPMYALATLPLIMKLPTSVEKSWYADDAAATGNIACIRDWWNEVSRLGPCYGYYPNASKTWLVTKREFLEEASTIFGDSQVTLGCPEYVS